MRVQTHTENLIVALVVAILLTLTALRTLGGLLQVESSIIFWDLFQAVSFTVVLASFYWYRGYVWDFFVFSIACLGLIWWSMSPTISAIPAEAAGTNLAVTLLGSPMAQLAATPAVSTVLLVVCLFLAAWAYTHLYN